MTDTPKFTEEDLSNWLQYESVRSSGLFHMFDSRARQKTGLSNDEYSFVMRNYSALKKEATGNE